jgi:hypothetical protein
LSSLYLQVLCEGIEDMTAEPAETVLLKVIRFVNAAHVAVGYKIKDLTVALITSRVFANFNFDCELRKALVQGMLRAQHPKFGTTRSPVVSVVLIAWVNILYSSMERKLRRAKTSNKQMGIAEVDHQTGIWTRETKSYNEWLQLVDSVAPGPTAQDWKWI